MSVTAMTELYRAVGRPTSGFCRRHGSSAGDLLPDTPNGRVNIGPTGLIRGKLPPQVGCELGDLAVGQAIPKGRHVAEIARCGRCDTMQDHLDQIVRPRAVQVAVQRQRWPAAEQRRPADLMAHRAGALVEPRADAGGRGYSRAGGSFEFGGKD